MHEEHAEATGAVAELTGDEAAEFARGDHGDDRHADVHDRLPGEDAFEPAFHRGADGDGGIQPDLHRRRHLQMPAQQVKQLEELRLGGCGDLDGHTAALHAGTQRAQHEDPRDPERKEEHPLQNHVPVQHAHHSHGLGQRMQLDPDPDEDQRHEHRVGKQQPQGDDGGEGKGGQLHNSPAGCDAHPRDRSFRTVLGGHGGRLKVEEA